MDARPRNIRYIQAFVDWLDSYAGQEIYGIILTRIDRVEEGLFGDAKSVGGGVTELRIGFGPGFRLYVGQDGDDVVMLYGGTKATQNADIAYAQALWKEILK